MFNQVKGQGHVYLSRCNTAKYGTLVRSVERQRRYPLTNNNFVSTSLTLTKLKSYIGLHPSFNFVDIRSKVKVTSVIFRILPFAALLTLTFIDTDQNHMLSWCSGCTPFYCRWLCQKSVVRYPLFTDRKSRSEVKITGIILRIVVFCVGDLSWAC